MSGVTNKKSKQNQKPVAGRRGGKRPGAGRKPGSRNKATLAREAGAATLAELAREETTAALGVLKEVATDSGQSGSARVTAAVALLDRAYGKPPQLTKIEGTVKPEQTNVNITFVRPEGTEETETRKDGKGE